nr:MAG TPA: hypothetical protein [Caudoviricetes sp.]
MTFTEMLDAIAGTIPCVKASQDCFKQGKKRLLQSD